MKIELKYLGLLLVLLLVLVYPATPPVPQESGEPPISSKIGETSSGLGASVSVNYQVQNKTFHECQYKVEVPTVPDYEVLDPGFGEMLENDGTSWTYYMVDTNSSQGRYRIIWNIQTPYTDLSKMYYDFKGWGVDVEEPTNGLDAFTCQIYVFRTDGSQSVSANTHNTWETGSVSLDSRYVQDGYIHGQFYMNCENSTGTLDRYYFYVDQLCFEFNTVSETRRSSYSVLGGTVKYEVAFETWDYNVNATLAPPSDWTFQDINPDCEQTANEFECLIPSVYTAIYTADVLATANWQEGRTWGFEEGWSYFWTPAGCSASLEYVAVLDGSASLKCSGSANTWVYSEDMTNDYAACWVVYSVFVESGAARIYVRDNDFWVQADITATGCWVSGVLHVDDLYNSAGRSVILACQAASSVVYWDAVAIYNSSVSMGQTITGTCRHIHPNGYTSAPYVDVELGLWDATYYWKEYQSVTTDSSGAWSFDTADFSTSLSTQSYHLWTWVYCDANGEWDLDAKTESTTDWSITGSAVSESVSVDTDAQEGLYSLQGEATDISASQFEQVVYDPTATFDGSGIFTFRLRLNSTGSFDMIYPYLREGANYQYSYIDQYRAASHQVIRLYASDDTWTFYAQPLAADYWAARSPSFDVTNLDYVRLVTVRVSGANVNYSNRVDGFNFIHYYTSDTLTCYQLGLSSASFTRVNDYESYFAVTGETYSNQLYTITLDGYTIAEDVEPNQIVERNNTVGSHTYSVTATSREDGASHLDSSAKTDSYTVYVTDLVSFRSYESESSMWFTVEILDPGLGTLYLKAWDNGSLVLPQTDVSNILKFSKSTVYGYHNVTVQVGSSSWGWQTYYCGYDVTKRRVFFSVYYSLSGTGETLDFDDFVFLLNGTRIYDRETWVEGDTLNITITDFYGNVITQNASYPYTEEANIGLAYYSTVFHNDGADVVYLIINQTGSAFYWNFTVDPDASISRRFYLGNYTVWKYYGSWDLAGYTTWNWYESVPVTLGDYEGQTVRVRHLPSIDNPDSPPGLTIISPAWFPVLAVLLILLIIGVYYDLKKKKS